MRASLRSWWMKIRSGLHWLGQKIRQHPIATGIVVVLIALAAFAFLVHRFGWNWTGFNGGFSKTTTTSTTHGITTTTEQPVTRTFWDWMQLLIVPIVLTFAAFLLNFTVNQHERAETQRRAETEREIALDSQRETMLQAYLDRMSELLLDENLRKSKIENEVRHVARARTLTILPQLDAIRKGSLIRFLYESGLIVPGKRDSVIDLSQAYLYRDDPRIEDNVIDLREADLSQVNLLGAKLSGANLARSNLRSSNLSMATLDRINLSFARLEKANLSYSILILSDFSWAYLQGANLTNTELAGADLTCADLSGADLSGAKLGRANLTLARLKGAKLKGAFLALANLKEVDLSEVDLNDVDLRYAIVTEEQLKKAKSLKGATMPDGSIHP